MLLFRSEDHIDLWCEANAIPNRPAVTLPQLWELAQEWYANRLTEGSRRPAAAEMTSIFSRIGLHGEFWRV